MIDFDNKEFFKLKHNPQYAEIVQQLIIQGDVSSIGKVKFEFRGSCNVVKISQYISAGVF